MQLEHLEQRRRERLEHPERLERLEHPEHPEHLHQNTNRHRILGYIFAKRIYPKSMQGSNRSKFQKQTLLPPYQPFNCLVQPSLSSFLRKIPSTPLPATLLP